MLSVCPNTMAFLDAVAARHGLRTRSEALRHVAAALAPVYGTEPPQVVLLRGAAAAKAQTQAERNVRHAAYESVRPFVQREHLSEFANWLNAGLTPTRAALSAALAAGLSPAVCEATFGVVP
jgi:hypothetical protein